MDQSNGVEGDIQSRGELELRSLIPDNGTETSGSISVLNL